MKNPFARLSLENISKDFSRVLTRFPIAFALMLGIATLFFIQLHGKLDTTTESMIFRMIFSGVVTFFLSVGVSLHTESHGVSRIKNYLFQALPVTFGALYYTGFSSNFDNERNVVFFLLTFAGIIAYLFFAPFIRKFFSKDAPQETYYTYFYTIATVFLISAILGGVLAALGNVAIWSVISLFDIKTVLTEKTYGDWMITALSILAPFFALAKLPVRETFESTQFHENAFFSFLIKYIAIPFIHIYFVILYAYSIKVLMNFSEWPKGEVSWMVIGFSLFGYLVYIFSYIFEEKNRFIRFFRTYFPAVVIPQLAMLGYAIYLRIAQYDVTMNRYFVVVFGIWLLTISLYLLISRKRYLGFIPAILTLFTILISVGPWSVYELPMARQMIRLDANLTKAHILQDGKIVPLKTYGDIDKELSKEIYEGIGYVCGFDDCESIKAKFPDQYAKIEADARVEFDRQKKEDMALATNAEMRAGIEDRTYEAPQKWQITSKLTEMIRVKTYYGPNDGEESIISFGLSNNESIYPLDIKGFSRLYQINGYYVKDTISPTSGHVTYDPKAQRLEVKTGEKVIDTIDLGAKIKALQEKYATTREVTLGLTDSVFDTAKYRVVIENISVGNPKYTGKDDTGGMGYINGVVLVK